MKNKTSLVLVLCLILVLTFVSCVSSDNDVNVKAQMVTKLTISGSNLVIKDQINTYSAVVEPKTVTEKVKWKVLPENQDFVKLIEKDRTCELKYLKPSTTKLTLVASIDDKEAKIENIKTLDSYPVINLVIKNEDNSKTLTKTLTQNDEGITVFNLSSTTNEKDLDLSKITYKLKKSNANIEIKNNQLKVLTSLKDQKTTIEIISVYPNNSSKSKTITITKPALNKLDIKGSGTLECNDKDVDYTIVKKPSNAYVDLSKLVVNVTPNLIKSKVENYIVSVKANNYVSDKQKITVSYDSKNYEKEITLKYVKTNSVTINEYNRLIIKGKTYNYTATVDPSNGTEKVKWSLSPGAENYVTLVDNNDNSCSLTYIANQNDISLIATSHGKEARLDNIKTLDSYPAINLVIKNEDNSKTLTKTLTQNDEGITKFNLSSNSAEPLYDVSNVNYSLVNSIDGVDITNNVLTINTDFNIQTATLKIIGADPNYSNKKVDEVSVVLNKPELTGFKLDDNIIEKKETKSFVVKQVPSNSFVDENITFSYPSSSLEIISQDPQKKRSNLKS